MRLLLGGLVLVVTFGAGCSPAPTLGLPVPSTDRTPPPATSSQGAAPSAVAPADLQAMLPATFDGVPAHTFDVGAELMARLAGELGVAPDAVAVAYASEHGPEFIQMMAIRVDGKSANELLAAFQQVAYPPGLNADVESAEQTIASRTVHVVSEPIGSFQVGTFYVLADGGALIVAQAFDRAIVERAVSALP